VLREIGALHANARSQAERSYATRQDVEHLKAALAGKAEYDLVKSAFDEEHAIFESKIAMVNEGMNDFCGKVMKAFSSVEAIETNLQQHVTGSFAEVVSAVKWLDTVTEQRLEKICSKIAAVEVMAGSASGPPRVPSSAPGFPDLSGCAAGPFACGQCGQGCPSAPLREPPSNIREPPSRRATSASAPGGCHCIHVTKPEQG